MKKIWLRSTTQGVRGGKNTHKDIGYGLLTVKRNGNSIMDIHIDTFEGSGKDYKEREDEVIDIWFPDPGLRFHGTAEELKQKLFFNNAKNTKQ